MLVEHLHLRVCHVLLFFCLLHEYLIVHVHSITVAHQLPIDILPPISSKRDKTLWIGGKDQFDALAMIDAKRITH